jgi:F-type H+-transporting ATPase subunit b
MEHIIHTPTFWVMIAFFVLMGVLIYLKVPTAIAKQLDSRATQIESDIREAEKLREEAQELLATYERKHKQALKEAEAILENAHGEAKRLGEQGKERLVQSLARREKMAMDRIAQVEAQAIDDVRLAAVEIAIDATRVLVTAEAKTTGDKLIDEAITDLGKKLH